MAFCHQLLIVNILLCYFTSFVMVVYIHGHILATWMPGNLGRIQKRYAVLAFINKYTKTNNIRVPTAAR